MGARRLLGGVAVVTGAAHGIGRAIAVELAREGASVWACDMLERELSETRRAVGERAEGPCRVAVVDVTDPRRVSEFVDELVAADGRVDVLVNCAGGVVGQTMRPSRRSPTRSGAPSSPSTSTAPSTSPGRSCRP